MVAPFLACLIDAEKTKHALAIAWPRSEGDSKCANKLDLLELCMRRSNGIASAPCTERSTLNIVSASPNTGAGDRKRAAACGAVDRRPDNGAYVMK